MLWEVSAVGGSIMVTGVLTYCALLYSNVCNLKTTQKNIHYSLIQELVLYKFKLGHNLTKATKIIFCMKGEDAVEYGAVTRCFKKFCSSCKTLNDKSWLSKSKSRDSEPNLVSSTWRVSGKNKILCSFLLVKLFSFFIL